MPDAVLFRGCLASTATLADIIIQKFFCHMPHYRLLQQLKVGLNSYGYSHSHDAAGRIEEIGKALESVEDIKLLLRILCDLHQISPGNYMLMYFGKRSYLCLILK